MQLARLANESKPQFRWIMTKLDSSEREREPCPTDAELIQLAPLRTRQEDIPDLSRTFVQSIVPDRSVRIESEVLEVFDQYDWPGNLHELRSVLSAASAVMRDDLVTVDDLPYGIVGATAAPDVPATLEEGRSSGEREVLLRTLKACGNNRTKAAQALGISRVALYKRLAKCGLN